MNYLLFFILGIIMWTLALKRSTDRKTHSAFGWFGLVVLLLCGMAVVFAEWVPVKIVLRSQLFRSTKFMTLFVLLYASYTIRNLWDKNAIRKFLAVITFLILFIPKYMPLLVILLLLYLLVEAGSSFWWIAPIVPAVLIFRAYAPHTAFPGSIDLNAIPGFIRPFLDDKLRITVLGLFLFWLVINKGTTIRFLRVSSSIIVILVVLLHVLPGAYHRMVTPLDQRGNWVKAQVWAKENTPQNAVFLTPPYKQNFRVHSERTIVAEVKDGTQQYFDSDYSYLWWERITDIGKNSEEYDNLNLDQLFQLGKKYNVSYLVFSAKKSMPFSHVYHNEDYRIYDYAEINRTIGQPENY